MTYESASELCDAAKQVLADFMVNNPFVSVHVHVAGENAKILRSIQTELHQQVRTRRKKDGISGRGVNLRVSSKEAEILKFLDASFTRSLVYGNQRSLFDRIDAAFAVKPDRQNILFVEDDVLLAGEALKEATALLAALDELFTQGPVPTAVVSALSLLNENVHLMDQVVRKIFSKSA